MPVIHIHNQDDPQLDDYRDIKDRDMLGETGRPGIFIGEQALIVEKMLAIPNLTKSVLILSNWVGRIAPLASENVPVYVVDSMVLEQIAGFQVHRGVLAVGYRQSQDALSIDSVVPKLGGPLTVLLCEDISNIDNIGMLFRNAAAFGVDAVVLSQDCHDPLYRKSIRVSIGHVFTKPWARSNNWQTDLERLKTEWNLTLIGTATTPNARSLDEIELPQRVGLIVGPEFKGLSETTLTKCDHIARIPMAKDVDSLNVGVAAAVCLHKFSRTERL